MQLQWFQCSYKFRMIPFLCHSHFFVSDCKEVQFSKAESWFGCNQTLKRAVLCDVWKTHSAPCWRSAEQKRRILKLQTQALAASSQSLACACVCVHASTSRKLRESNLQQHGSLPHQPPSHSKSSDRFLLDLVWFIDEIEREGETCMASGQLQ